MSSQPAYPVLDRDSTLAQLPPEHPVDAQDQISHILSTSSLNRLVVLDDDPTGTQTCHDISVLAVWDLETLVEEFKQDSPGFFILTNSRALPPYEADKLIRQILPGLDLSRFKKLFMSFNEFITELLCQCGKDIKFIGKEMVG